MADDTPDKPGFLVAPVRAEAGTAPEPKSVPPATGDAETLAGRADDRARAAIRRAPPGRRRRKLPAGSPEPTCSRSTGPAAAALPSGPPSDPAGGGDKGWWQRLTQGMRRTSSSLVESVTGLFTKRQLDAATLEDLEDVLVRADLGLDTAARIAKAVGEGRYDKEIAPAEVKAILAGEVEKALAPVAKPLAVDRAKKPFVILMVGGQRLRQDDHHRQARAEIPRRRASR